MKALVFDDDSNDSGFNEECKQQIFENSFLSVSIKYNNRRENNLLQKKSLRVQHKAKVQEVHCRRK